MKDVDIVFICLAFFGIMGGVGITHEIAKINRNLSKGS